MENVVTIEAAPVAATEKRRGRPVVPGSVRQMKLLEKAERIDNGYVGRGRPINSESKRQQVLAERLAKISSGIEIKRGRPKMAKPTPEEDMQQTLTQVFADCL